MVSLKVEMWADSGHKTITLGTWRWPVVPSKGDYIVLHGESCQIKGVYHDLEGRFTSVRLFINFRLELAKWAEERELRADEPGELTDELDEWEKEQRNDEMEADGDHEGGTE